MQIKIKKENNDGIVRVESSGKIIEVFVKENILRPNKESIDVCFRGLNSSGILSLSKEEANKICKTIKKNLDLVKEVQTWN